MRFRPDVVQLIKNRACVNGISGSGRADFFCRAAVRGFFLSGFHGFLLLFLSGLRGFLLLFLSGFRGFLLLFLSGLRGFLFLFLRGCFCTFRAFCHVQEGYGNIALFSVFSADLSPVSVNGQDRNGIAVIKISDDIIIGAGAGTDTEPAALR